MAGVPGGLFGRCGGLAGGPGGLAAWWMLNSRKPRRGKHAPIRIRGRTASRALAHRVVRRRPRPSTAPCLLGASRRPARLRPRRNDAPPAPWASGSRSPSPAGPPRSRPCAAPSPSLRCGGRHRARSEVQPVPAPWTWTMSATHSWSVTPSAEKLRHQIGRRAAGPPFRSSRRLEAPPRTPECPNPSSGVPRASGSPARPPLAVPRSEGSHRSPRCRIMADPVVAARFATRGRVFKPVQGALPRQRRTVLPMSIELAGEQRQNKSRPAPRQCTDIPLRDVWARPLHQQDADGQLDRWPFHISYLLTSPIPDPA